MKTIKALLLALILMILTACGGSGGSNPPVPPTPPNPPTVIYNLQNTYQVQIEDNELLFGGLLEGEFDEIVTRLVIIDPDGPNHQACWTKSVLYKNQPDNSYYLQAYDTASFPANAPGCEVVEGNYWIKLTSDYEADFTKSNQ